MDSLLESIGEEPSTEVTEELEDLEKQQHQFEEEVEAERHPTVPAT